MNQKQKNDLIKSELAKLRRFGGRCYVCGCKAHKRGMTFHHLWYLKTGDVIYSVYKKLGKLPDYYPDLKPLILDKPERFLYVCSPHHQSIERLKRFSKIKLNRLIKAVRMST